MVSVKALGKSRGAELKSGGICPRADLVVLGASLRRHSSGV